MSGSDDHPYIVSSNQSNDVCDINNMKCHEKRNKVEPISLLRISASIVHVLEIIFYR